MRSLESRIAAWLFAAAAVSFAAGCGNGSAKQSLGFSEAANAKQAGNTAVPKVTTAAVTVVNRNESVGLTGTLEPDEETCVASKVSGNVQKIFVDRGSMVKKGDPLVQLDPTDARNNLAEGEASAEELRVKLGLKKGVDAFDPTNMPDVKVVKTTLDLAERNFHRYESLIKTNVIARTEFDKISTEYDAARNQYEQVQRQARQTYQSYKTELTKVTTLRQALADTLIVAPFDGMVVEKMTAVGERVEVMMGGGQVIKMVKVNPLRLIVTVPQQYVGQIRPGQIVSFSVEGFAGKTFQGRVKLISPALETATRSLTVEANVDNSDNQLHPGLFATAQLELGASSPAMFVPASALSRDGDVMRLFVAVQGVARQKLVTVGESSGGSVRIVTGINSADRVIVNPSGLQDGVKIQ